MNIQKRGVRRIILRFALSFRKQVWHQSVFAVCCKRTQYALCRLKLLRRNTAPCQCDHRIPSPVLKKRKSCQYRLTACGFPFCNKLMRAFYELFRRFLFQPRDMNQFSAISGRFLKHLVSRRMNFFHAV